MIEWEERYATGNESIDRQHKFLFNMFNDFGVCIKSGEGQHFVVNSFPLLESYTKAHFAFEEECMDQHKCSSFSENKEAHQDFLRKIKHFQTQFNLGQRDDIVVQMHSFIEEWITVHIMTVDLHLKSCIKNKENS